MTKHNINSKKGFTIIEVVLVLAIAGLIFLMVFIALPNLQRTQRDTQRRNDLDRVSSSLIQYVTNNNRLPDESTTVNGSVLVVNGEAVSALPNSDDYKYTDNDWAKFYFNYLLAGGSDNFVDPNGDGYNLAAYDASADGELATANNAITGTSADLGFPAGTFTIVVVRSAQCTGDETAPFAEVAGARKFAVALKLEGNGIYCLAN